MLSVVQRGRLVASGLLRMDPAAALAPASDRANIVLDRFSQRQQQSRGMARGRYYYIKGASNKQDLSEETRDLLKNAKDPEDRSWRLGPGIQEPLTMDPTTKERKEALQYSVKYYGDQINDGDDVVKYYPHAGEELPDGPPSPVLMVRRVKDLYAQPWFNKNYCSQIGLGDQEKLSKLVFLPNLPSVSLILFKIKHLISITPVTFPNGIPEDFDPETHGYKLNLNGEFIVHPSLRNNPHTAVEGAEWMKIDRKQIQREASRHWQRPFNSPLGHSNYHADTRWRDNDKAASQHTKNMKKKWSK